MESIASQWDAYATEYARWLAEREPRWPEGNAILIGMLDLLGDVAGREVLDAGCGEGLLARILASRGARVTGIDLSPRLIQMARERDPRQEMDYRVADLSGALPELENRFDLIGSYMALNDVQDYRGFAATLASIGKPGSRTVIGFNNPYSSIVRRHVADYFASGSPCTYGGLSAAGVKVRYYHRTLEEYLDAFLTAGLRLFKLIDVPSAMAHPDLPEGCRFSNFMILAFDKP
jgi:2-polyprenyl-3-methyl-5-hydroxy-6-metoxy-1,4-benzoquinol methylase